MMCYLKIGHSFWASIVNIFFSEMLKKGMYACPMCGLAMQNMSDVWARLDSEIAITPMPRYQTKIATLNVIGQFSPIRCPHVNF